MKARIKKTGKIVNIYAECLAGFLADDGSYYEDDELSTGLDDWSSFRREAAKDILASFASNSVVIDDRPDAFAEDFYSKIAVEWADSLIKQLKKKDERPTP